MPIEITQLLKAWRDGDKIALDPAMPQLYELLRQMAAQRLRGEATSISLDPTDLVHEALARLLGGDKHFANHAHFLALGALYMRSILVDRAREILAGRRGNTAANVTINTVNDIAGDSGAMDVVVLDNVLNQLHEADERAARAMELSCFAGMQREEIASVLEVSIPTVDRDLRFARAWVNRAMA
jgi:RNA polymerase sigma factor (TIGR02999 family)